jgi:hypothetical protein
MTATERVLLEVARTEWLLEHADKKRAFSEALVQARHDWLPASKQTRLRGLQVA